MSIALIYNTLYVLTDYEVVDSISVNIKNNNYSKLMTRVGSNSTQKLCVMFKELFMSCNIDNWIIRRYSTAYET